MSTICVDFDHTICDSRPEAVQPGYKMGPPLPGAIEAVRQLAQTNTIIIFSARAVTLDGARSIEDWMRHFGVPYQRITAIKPKDAAVFVDDRGYRFLDWQRTMKELPRVIAENRERLDRPGSKQGPDPQRYLGRPQLAGS